MSEKILFKQIPQTFDPIVMLAVASNNAGWLISNGVCSQSDLEKALRLGLGLKKEC